MISTNQQVVKYRYEGLQSILGVAGESACHFLVLCSIAEEFLHRPIDLIDAIRTAIHEKWMDEEFTVTVKGSTDLLGYLTKHKWSRKDVVKLGKINDNDYTELKYYNPNTQKIHFTRKYINTLYYSRTVEEGNVICYYVYTVEM